MDQSRARPVVLVSPWALSFAAQITARWAHVVVGLIVAALTRLKLRLMHQIRAGLDLARNPVARWFELGRPLSCPNVVLVRFPSTGAISAADSGER